MVFSSLLFLTLFLPLTMILYYLLPGRYKNILLLIVSLIFYAWGEPKHIILMLITTVYTWLLSLLLEKCLNSGRTGAARIILILCLVFSLGTLFFYKYSGFVMRALGQTAFSAPALPIGISFYTFQSLSYVIDVYRGDVKAQRSWVNFAMYISLFPQLIAGPIVRYADVENQLAERTHSCKNIYRGIRRFTFGLAKKVLLANQIGLLWDSISGMGNLSTLGAWLGAVAFSLQIYFDFSAYSDMAIGLGRMFGFEFTENFRYPYQSKSNTEFWRRWHLTLGTWFREYVYIPLGGNRKGKGRQALNLLIVWSLTGLWHGADWQFLLWGIYYFLFLTLEKFFLLQRMEKWPSVVRHLYTVIVVVFGWVIFACEDLTATGDFFKAMLGIGVPLTNNAALFQLRNFAFLLPVLLVGATELPRCIILHLRHRVHPAIFEKLTYAACLATTWVCIAFLVADTYNPFLYFRF